MISSTRACLYGGRVTESPEPTAVADPAGAVREPTVTGLPAGYTYGVTRYADIILQQAFPTQFDDIVTVLSSFMIDLNELRVGGGGRTVFVRPSMERSQPAGGARKPLRSARLSTANSSPTSADMRSICSASVARPTHIQGSPSR